MYEFIYLLVVPHILSDNKKCVDLYDLIPFRSSSVKLQPKRKEIEEKCNVSSNLGIRLKVWRGGRWEFLKKRIFI
jgi:hypothetical protein